MMECGNIIGDVKELLSKVFGDEDDEKYLSLSTQELKDLLIKEKEKLADDHDQV